MAWQHLNFMGRDEFNKPTETINISEIVKNLDLISLAQIKNSLLILFAGLGGKPKNGIGFVASAKIARRTLRRDNANLLRRRALPHRNVGENCACRDARRRRTANSF